MIGLKSICKRTQFTINGVTYHIFVQANKNLGICDIYIISPQPADTYKSIRQEVLNKFQGRPINNEYILEMVFNYIYSLLSV